MSAWEYDGESPAQTGRERFTRYAPVAVPEFFEGVYCVVTEERRPEYSKICLCKA